MLSILPEVQDFGDEDEKNCQTNEINKEDVNEFCIFIANQESENTKHATKYDKQTLCKFCQRENEKREVKDVLFPC